MSEGWPGVFRPLRHHVLPGARRLLVRGSSIAFGVCGSPCWPPAEFGADLPWCAECWAAQRRGGL